MYVCMYVCVCVCVCMYVCICTIYYYVCTIGYVVPFRRLKKLLKCEGSYAMGGETNKDDLYIAPTIITHVNTSDAIMTDEVGFGTIHAYIP